MQYPWELTLHTQYAAVDTQGYKATQGVTKPAHAEMML